MSDFDQYVAYRHGYIERHFIFDQGGQMPYIYVKVEDLEGTELVGTHQCVALIQHYGKVPVSSAWRQGEHVVEASTLKKERQSRLS